MKGKPRGKLVARLGSTRPSWVLIHRVRKDALAKDLAGVFRCTHTEPEDAQGRVQEVRVLLEPGDCEITVGCGTGSGHEVQCARVKRDEDTVVELP